MSDAATTEDMDEPLELSNPQRADFSLKGVRPNIISYAIMAFTALVLSVMGLSHFDALSNYVSYIYLGAYFLFFYGLAAWLTFDVFRQYSCYGISHNHFYLNHALSILAVGLPFLSLLVHPYLFVLTFAVLSYSYYVSHKDRYKVYALNAVLMCVMFAAGYAQSQISKQEIFNTDTEGHVIEGVLDHNNEGRL